MADGGVGVAETQGANLAAAVDALKQGNEPVGTSIGAAVKKGAPEAKPAATTPETNKPTAENTQDLKNAGAIDPAFQAQLESLKKSNIDAMTPGEVNKTLRLLVGKGSIDLITSLRDQYKAAQENYHPRSHEGQELKAKEEEFTDMLKHLEKTNEEVQAERERLKKGTPEEQAFAIEIDSAEEKANYYDALESTNKYKKDFIAKMNKEQPGMTLEQIEILLDKDPGYLNYKKDITEMKRRYI